MFSLKNQFPYRLAGPTDPNYDFVHRIIVPTEVGPSKVNPWTYPPIEIELGKLPRYSQPYKSVEFKFY